MRHFLQLVQLQDEKKTDKKCSIQSTCRYLYMWDAHVLISTCVSATHRNDRSYVDPTEETMTVNLSKRKRE